MPKKLLTTIKGGGESPVDVWISGNSTYPEVLEYIGDLDVDCDGIGGNPHNDPYFQSETRLKFQGISLHAELVPFVVVDPTLISLTKGVMMGSYGIATNLKNGKRSEFVVGDSGPYFKIGEGSPALCDNLGLDSNPNHGGTDEQIIKIKIWVGRQAIIPIRFNLQPS